MKSICRRRLALLLVSIGLAFALGYAVGHRNGSLREQEIYNAIYRLASDGRAGHGPSAQFFMVLARNADLLPDSGLKKIVLWAFEELEYENDMPDATDGTGPKTPSPPK